jgi:plasmid stability protein
MTRHLHPALLALLWLAAAAGPTRGQDYVDTPCKAGPAPRFEDHLQSLWYRRFWTGECKDLPALKCRSGRPYWNDVVRTLTARTPEEKRPEVASRACRLGRRIGFEWTRPSAERRINSQDLRALDSMLEKAPDVEAGLAAVEARVQAKIGP